MIGFRALLGSSRLFKSPALKTLGTALLLGVPLAGCEQEVDVALPPPVAKKPLDAKTIGDAELKSLVDQAIQTTADRTLDERRPAIGIARQYAGIGHEWLQVPIAMHRKLRPGDA